MGDEKLIRHSGNYRKLLSYQKAEVIFSFCSFFPHARGSVPPRSFTKKPPPLRHHLISPRSMLTTPPPVTKQRQELLSREPVKTDIHRVPIQIPLPIILQPMCRPQNTPQMTGILLLHARLLPQILQHLLCLNPFHFFHNIFRQMS